MKGIAQCVICHNIMPLFDDEVIILSIVRYVKILYHPNCSNRQNINKTRIKKRNRAKIFLIDKTLWIDMYYLYFKSFMNYQIELSILVDTILHFIYAPLPPLNK